MARHFASLESTQEFKRPRKARREDTQARQHMPYGATAGYRPSYANAAFTEEYDEDYIEARGGIHAFLRGIVLLLAWALRLCAIGMVLVVILNFVSFPSLAPYVSRITDPISALVPWASWDLLSVDTPFGGSFRGDLALVALALFVLDWLLCKLRSHMA